MKQKILLRKVSLGFLFFIFFNLTTTVYAASLYEAEIPIPSQTEDLKEQAIQEGFLQVLTKLSGNGRIMENPIIKENATRAAYFVQEYSYSAPTTASSEYYLRIRYESKDIDRLLQEAGVPYWKEERPTILVLTTLPSPTGMDILSRESNLNLSFLLQQEAYKLGFPVLFPMMDMNEMEQLSAQDIANMNLPLLEKVAKKYAPNALLIGTIKATDSGFEGDWHFLLKSPNAKDWSKVKTWDFKITENTQEEVLITLIQELGLQLAQYFIVKTEASELAWLKLKISNITDQEDLTNLVAYLRKLTSVQDVKLVQINQNLAEVKILIHGTPEHFQRMALMGKHLLLQQDSAPTDSIPQPGFQQVFAYQWIN